MKCFAAFSILAALAGLIIWGVYTMIAKGQLAGVIAVLILSALAAGASVAVIWAIFTAIECWSNR